MASECLKAGAVVVVFMELLDQLHRLLVFFVVVYGLPVEEEEW